MERQPRSEYSRLRPGYGTTPGSYSASVDVGNALTHSITALTSGTRYYFAVRAYNTSNVSGPLSSEVNEVAIDTPPPPPPPPPVLVAAYGFGEASGSSAVDKTSNDNDGTLGGGITRTSAGRFGSALVFDGINGIVTIPSTTSLDLTGATPWKRGSRPRLPVAGERPS